jgi:hypothetical protein
MIRREIDKYLALHYKEVNGLKLTMTKTWRMPGSEVLLY